MKPNLPKVQNIELDKVIIVLKQILSNVNLDNIKHRIINGTTDVIADTKRSFPHGMVPRPWAAIPLTQDGGVYIKTISETDVDIRSTKSSSNFEMIFIG